MTATAILTTTTLPDGYTAHTGEYGDTYGSVTAPSGALLSLESDADGYFTTIYPEFGNGSTARAICWEHSTAAQARAAIATFCARTA